QVGEQRRDDHDPQRDALDREGGRQAESGTVCAHLYFTKLGMLFSSAAWRSLRCLRAISAKTTPSKSATKMAQPTATIQYFSLSAGACTISGCKPTVTAKYQAKLKAPIAA